LPFGFALPKFGLKLGNKPFSKFISFLKSFLP